MCGKPASRPAEVENARRARGAAECSIRTVQSGTVNESGSIVRLLRARAGISARRGSAPNAGTFQAEISSFALRLAAEGKAAPTIRTYAEAVQWFAAYLLEQAGRASWEQVDCQDIQLWMAWLLDRYSNAYASNQYRAL